MGSRYRLSNKLSFRTLPSSAVLIDHASGQVHSLNREAGEVLDRLEAGQTEFDPDDEEFIDQLVELGIVGDSSDAGHYAVEEDDVVVDLLEELNLEAASNLVPLHCQIELTYRCRLRCRHCYLGHCGSDSAKELRLDEIECVLDRLREMGGLFLLLTGGEPFLRDDFEEIFSLARDRRFAVSFITSGWNFDEELLGRLAKRGIDSAQVSLYGPDASSHDNMTGVPGSFDQALGCMRTLRDLGVRVRAAVTPTVDTVHRVEEIAALLEREGIAAGLGLYMTPTREGDDAPARLTVDEPGLARVLRVFPPDASPRMAGREMGDRPCGAGASSLAIDPFGTVYPCLLLRTPVGSIRETSLDEIWKHSDGLKAIRDVTLADLEDCPDCDLREHCNRCAAFALLEGKSIIDHSAFDCLQAKVVYKVYI